MAIGRRATAVAVAFVTLGAVSCASTTRAPAQVSAPVSSESPSAQPQISEAPSASPQQAIPESLKAACGHPGAQAVVTTIPITVPRAECDLTGVVVLYGPTGVTVPGSGGVEGFWDGISSSFEFGANVDPTTGDVTFNGGRD
jgi:hypothetical protein